LLTLEILKENGELSHDEQSYRSKDQVQPYNIYAEEENYWYQMAHARWLLEGNQNTTYFHIIANGRKMKKTLSNH
jgi:mannosylglycoprotein endo-beta-mannosidase